jgi:hypothetical protein
MKRLAAAAAAAAAALLSVAGPATAARVHLVVSPATVSPGGSIRVGATSSPCPAHDRVALLSAAYPGHAFGIGAVYGRVGRRGAFSVLARIRSTLRPGRYHVGVRCGGGNLGVLAYFRVY